MPVTEKKYPDWVQSYRTKRTTVKKKGGSYYLYKRTSHRVKGKKYPQPVDTYIGVITPDGVIQSTKKKVSPTDAEVWEYDFSKAVWEFLFSETTPQEHVFHMLPHVISLVWKCRILMKINRR